MADMGELSDFHPDEQVQHVNDQLKTFHESINALSTIEQKTQSAGKRASGEWQETASVQVEMEVLLHHISKLTKLLNSETMTPAQREQMTALVASVQKTAARLIGGVHDDQQVDTLKNEVHLLTDTLQIQLLKDVLIEREQQRDLLIQTLSSLSDAEKNQLPEELQEAAKNLQAITPDKVKGYIALALPYLAQISNKAKATAAQLKKSLASQLADKKNLLNLVKQTNEEIEEIRCKIDNKETPEQERTALQSQLQEKQTLLLLQPSTTELEKDIADMQAPIKEAEHTVSSFNRLLEGVSGPQILHTLHQQVNELSQLFGKSPFDVTLQEFNELKTKPQDSEDQKIVKKNKREALQRFIVFSQTTTNVKSDWKADHFSELVPMKQLSQHFKNLQNAQKPGESQILSLPDAPPSTERLTPIDISKILATLKDKTIEKSTRKAALATLIDDFHKDLGTVGTKGMYGTAAAPVLGFQLDEKAKKALYSLNISTILKEPYTQTSINKFRDVLKFFESSFQSYYNALSDEKAKDAYGPILRQWQSVFEGLK